MGATGLLLLGPLSLLTLIGETRPGRLTGWLALTLLAILVVVAICLVRPPIRFGVVGAIPAVLGIVAVALIAGIIQARPLPRQPEEPYGLRQFFVDPGQTPSRTPLSFLPEVDQVHLGATVVSRIVPWMTREESRRLRDVPLRLYREMDPDARALPPVTHLALAELAGLDFDNGHAFTYIPRPNPGERLGAIVFLHGNAGNFKLLAWAWRPFAERERFAILCPTFGYGLWNEGGVEAVERVLAAVLSRFPIDPERVYLGGISDGGKGVTRSATAHPERYRGLIYISPTMLLDELSAPAFTDVRLDRPMLVLHGGRDWNVRPETVDAAVALLRRKRANVTYRRFPDDDHFLFFARRDEILDRVGDWIHESAGPKLTDAPAIPPD